MEQISMLKGMRLGGVTRYFAKKALDVCGVLAACALVTSLISAGFIVWGTMQSGEAVGNLGLSFLYSANSVVLIILCAYAAYGETRYLAILPTPRYSIYLGVIEKIVLFSVAASATAALHTLFDVLIAQALNSVGLARIPIIIYSVDLSSVFSVGETSVRTAETFGQIAQLALHKSADAAIRMIELGGVWYLYLCLLRRWKGATLAVTIGAPILLVMLLITPALTGWIDRFAAMSEAEIMQAMPLIYDIVKFAEKVIDWMAEKWPWVRAIAGIVCYAIAYPVMRGTPQPN